MLSDHLTEGEVFMLSKCCRNLLIPGTLSLSVFASGMNPLVMTTAQAGTATNVVTTAQLAFGQMTVESGGVTRAITTPGFQVVSVSAVVAPSRPAPAPPDGGLGDKLSGLEGPGGDSTGGAPEAPTNEDVAETQISRMGSNIQPQSIVVAPKFNDAPPPPGGVVQVGKKLTLIGKKTVIA